MLPQRPSLSSLLFHLPLLPSSSSYASEKEETSTGATSVHDDELIDDERETSLISMSATSRFGCIAIMRFLARAILASRTASR